MKVDFVEMERSVPNLAHYKNFIDLCIDFKKSEMQRRSPILDDKERYFTARNICVQSWKNNSSQINDMMERITKNNTCYSKCKISIKNDAHPKLTDFFKK